MTRLTEDDVRDLSSRLTAFQRDLVAVSGLALHKLAQRTVDVDRALTAATEWIAPTVAFGDLPATAAVPFEGARVAAVPVSSGEGLIPGFCECVAAILRHLGCNAHVTSQSDVRGLQEAADGGDEVVFIADDFRFVALDIRSGRCADDDPATADGYVTALAAAAGGLAGRPVLLLGLGPVGRAAGRRLAALGADLFAVDPDAAAVVRAADEGLVFTQLELADGLARCDLVFDATPAADIVTAADLQPGTIAAVPGVPSAFDAGARKALDVRHIHEPLAVGVAVMAARALAGD
jgi:pyrrolysine biosynthesis protein PylD